MTGLYIHIPFCTRKCLYCDFPSYGGISRYQEAYVDALCREIRNSPYAGQAVDTVYFGGGTPSLLTLVQVGMIMRTLGETFRLAADSEITLEANPESMDRAYAAGLAHIGINRVSLGIQSFNDKELRFLRRLHTGKEAMQSVCDVYEGGITNISVDLMYGLPGQSRADVLHDLSCLVSLPVVHASVYSFIVETGTPLAGLVGKGSVLLPETEITLQEGAAVRSMLADRGFAHYEISSYARPGFASRHNIKYWQYEPYIGFGVSAHSFDGRFRFVNIGNIPQYIEAAGMAAVSAEREEIRTMRGEEDYCFLALRMRRGIDSERFQSLFGETVESAFGPVLEDLDRRGFIEPTGRGYKLTEQGLLYGNYVFSRFLR